MDAASLRSWRARMGYTQEEAASALRTPYRTYRRWESSGAPGVVEIAAALLERSMPLA